MTLSLHHWRPLLMVAVTAMMASATSPVTTTLTSATSASLMAPLSIPKTGASMSSLIPTAFKVPDMKPPRSVSLRLAQLRSPKLLCHATKDNDATVATITNNSDLPEGAVKLLGEKDGVPVYQANWGPQYEIHPDDPADSQATACIKVVPNVYLNGHRITKYVPDFIPNSAVISADGPAESQASASNNVKLVGYMNGLPMYVDAELYKPTSGVVSAKSDQDGPAESLASASQEPKLIGYMNDYPIYVHYVNSKPHSASAQAHEDGPAKSQTSASDGPEGKTSDEAECSQKVVENAQQEPRISIHLKF